MRQSFLTDEDQKEMISMFRLGIKKADISRQFQVNSRTVDDVLLRHKKYGRKVTTPYALNIVEAAKQGYTTREISEITGAATSYVVRVCQSHFLPIRKYEEHIAEYMVHIKHFI